jgi:murein DD-endopeptidase MepM/ murein hydrolase activator NlpD
MNPCRLLAIIATCASTLGPCPSWGGVGLEISVRARALAPGEPLRIEVVSPTPLESLTGAFGELEIAFSRSTATADGWSGWSMIGLDEPPGVRSIEVQGRTVEGALVNGTQAVTIVARHFPEERLDVEQRYVEPPREVQERLEREGRLLDAIYARRSAPPDLAPFVKPVPGAPTSEFGIRRFYNGVAKAPHPGLDLRAATGTPVRSSGSGQVVLARDLYYSGGTVIVDHGGGLFTIYAHLSKIGATEGETIAAGEQLGLSGATGRVTGPHLHWGAKIGERPFDPRALLDPVLWCLNGTG